MSQLEKIIIKNLPVFGILSKQEEMLQTVEGSNRLRSAEFPDEAKRMRGKNK